jgi:1,4-alpha-glucan branching enzyme
MYMSAADRQFGAWRLDDDAASSAVRFSIFIPDRARDPAQYAAQPVEPPRDAHGVAIAIERYGDPRIASIHVVGDFQTALGRGADWTAHPANALARTPHASGWVWRVDTAPLPAGFYQYRYRVAFEDGSTREVADPCARYGGADLLRPTSAVVVGPSATPQVAPVAGGRRPLRDLVVYELDIDDFTAELRGAHAALDAIHRADLGTGRLDAPTGRTALDHLADLGVNAILFLPWTAWNDGAFSWGYTPYSYFSVEHRYTNDLTGAEPETKQLSRLRDLVNACHARGIHVIMDGVFNHVGPDDGASQTGFAYRWLYQDPGASPYSGRFGGTFPGLVDLDYHNGCTQQLVSDVCRYWMDEFGIDGLRLDNTVNFYLAKDDGAPASQEGLPRLLADVRAHAADPAFSLTIEHLDLSAASVVTSTDATSYWSNALYGACFDALWSGRVTPPLLAALDAHAWLASPDKVATTYLSNHDHSHVTWRCGARDDTGSISWWRTQPWAIALLTSPGTPMLQNGQEFAEDHWIPEDDRGTGRRVKGRPLRWGYASDPVGRTLVALYRRLIALRNTYAALRSDGFYPPRWETWQTHMNPQGYGLDTERQLAIYHRWGRGEDGRLQRFIVALNFSEVDQQVDVPFPANGTWTDLLPLESPGGVPVEVQGFWLARWTLHAGWGAIFFQSTVP